MSMLRRVLRPARLVVETVLAGLLLGVVGTVLVSELITTNGGSTAAEVPQARSFMLALVRNDLDAMSKLGPSADAVSQAINFQKQADALKNVTVGSLTYLGGSALGGVGVHVYVVEVDSSAGAHLEPVTLTVVEGKVVHVQG